MTNTANREVSSTLQEKVASNQNFQEDYRVNGTKILDIPGTPFEGPAANESIINPPLGSGGIEQEN